MSGPTFQARKFQRFVTDTVLVALANTGGYLLNETARATAHADPPTEMPLPAGFGDLLKAVLDMGEKHDRQSGGTIGYITTRRSQWRARSSPSRPRQPADCHHQDHRDRRRAVDRRT